MGWGTNLPQEDYLKLEQEFGVQTLTDAEAVLLINREFGFEAGRIQILHETGVVNAEKSGGERGVILDKIPRKPLYAATDWNYVRFNVRTVPADWYYEMINGDLRFVAE